MQEGETGSTLEKRHDRGTGIEAVLVRAPRLQRTAGHVQPLGRLTLGDPLDVQLTIPRKQGRAFEARPALVTILIATLLVLDYRCHRDLLVQPFAFQSCWRRTARWLSGFNPYGCRVAEFLGWHLD